MKLLAREQAPSDRGAKRRSHLDTTATGGASGSTRTLGGPARILAAWLVASCITLALTILAPAAQAEVLVSNIGETASGNINIGGASATSGIAAQAFMTGSNETGYDLTSIDIEVTNIPTTASDVTVSLYTVSSGNPATSLHVLANPATFVVGTNTFTAPANTMLDANTSYHVRIESAATDSSDFQLSITTSKAETSAAAGWTIADDRRYLNTNIWRTWTTNVHQIRVNGTTRAPLQTPTITNIEITSDPGEDDTYGIGDDIDVTVTFDTDITLNTSGGTPSSSSTSAAPAKAPSAQPTQRRSTASCAATRSQRTTPTPTASPSARTTSRSKAAQSPSARERDRRTSTTPGCRATRGTR